MPHVEVSHNEHVIRVLSEFGQAHEHTVEKAVFVILAGRSNLAGVHVGAYDGQGFAGGQGVVRLNPAASVREIVFADRGAGGDRLVFQQFTVRIGVLAGCHQYPGASFGGGFGVQNIPVVFVEKFAHDLIGGTNLLQTENINVAASEPRGHIFPVGGTNTVDVHAGDAQSFSGAAHSSPLISSLTIPIPLDAVVLIVSKARSIMARDSSLSSVR